MADPRYSLATIRLKKHEYNNLKAIADSKGMSMNKFLYMLVELGLEKFAEKSDFDL